MSNYNKIPLRIFNTKAELDAYYEDITPYEVGLYISDNKYIVGYFPEEGGDANPNPFSGENHTLPNYVPDSPIEPPTPTGTLDKYLYFRNPDGNGDNVPFLYQGVAYLTKDGLTYDEPESGEYETITGPTTLYIEYNENNTTPVELEFSIVVEYIKNGEADSTEGTITVTSDPANDEVSISYSLQDGELTDTKTYLYSEYLDKFYGEEAGVTADDFNCNIPVLPIKITGWFDWQTILEVDSIENEDIYVTDNPQDLEFIYPFEVTDNVESKVYDEVATYYMNYIADIFSDCNIKEVPIDRCVLGAVDSDNDLDTHNTLDNVYSDIEYIVIPAQTYAQPTGLQNLAHTFFAKISSKSHGASLNYNVTGKINGENRYFEVGFGYGAVSDPQVVISINEVVQEGEGIAITLEYATLEEYMETFDYTEPSEIIISGNPVEFIPVNVYDIFENIPAEYSFPVYNIECVCADSGSEYYIHKDLLDEDSSYYEDNDFLKDTIRYCFVNNREYKETNNYSMPLLEDIFEFYVYFTQSTPNE